MDTLKGIVGQYLRYQVNQIRLDIKSFREAATNAYRWYVDK